MINLKDIEKNAGELKSGQVIIIPRLSKKELPNIQSYLPHTEYKIKTATSMIGPDLSNLEVHIYRRL